MIRMSEMFLIAAESGFDQDKENAISLLEELRLNRGIGGEISSTISAEKFREELTIEARREFLGEGQIFFMFKRLNQSVPTVSNWKSENFVLNVPDSENI